MMIAQAALAELDRSVRRKSSSTVRTQSTRKSTNAAMIRSRMGPSMAGGVAGRVTPQG